MTLLKPLELNGVIEITPRKFADGRGFFSETFNSQHLANAGLGLTFVQDNHSYSARRGVLRGLHYQLPPKAQDKLIRVTRGSIFDVAVDIRQGSPSFGKWVGIEISASKWNQIFIPNGFAHGFVTLEDATEVIYKVTDFYSPEHERCIRYDDADIGIDWPIDPALILLSDKDKNGSSLRTAQVFENNPSQPKTQR